MTRIDELSWGFELHKTFTLKQDITFKLSNAGHILGSKDTPILPDPDPPETCDLLILESTYGDRNHPSRKGRIEALQKLLHKAHRRDGGQRGG